MAPFSDFRVKSRSEPRGPGCPTHRVFCDEWDRVEKSRITTDSGIAERLVTPYFLIAVH